MKLSEFLKSLEKAKEYVKKKDPEILIYHDSGNRYTITTVMEHTEKNKRQYIFIHGGDKHNDLTPIDRSKSALAARKAFVKKVKYGDYESKIEIPPPVNYTSLDLDLTEEVLVERIKEAKKKYQENTKRDYFKENEEDQKRLDELFFKDLMRVYFPNLKEDSNEYKIILGCNNFYTKEYTVNLFERLLKETKNGKKSNG
jgi:hypothetical protein